MEIWKSHCQVRGKQFCEINDAPQICCARGFISQPICADILSSTWATFFRTQKVANTTISLMEKKKNSNCNFMKYDFICQQLECRYIYRMLDFQPVGGKTTNSSSRNGSFALQTRAAHYLLESEHTPTNGCGDVYNSSNKTRRKTDPQSAPLSPFSINDCSGRGRERVMDAGRWRLSPSPLWWNGKSQHLPADWAAGD